MRRSLPLLVFVPLALAACRGTLEVTPSDAETVLAHRTLDAPDPGLPGPHGVLTLTYGSGDDRNRPEYADGVSMVTESVDGSKLVDFGGAADDRRDYWGFGSDELPLNGRVWYPDGDGPFPLVLVVHGNHDPEDYSDPGYDYLGELLASRGFILASIDMNFINGSRVENEARAWLLLKHLEAWERFDEDADGPMSGRVDMTRIALMGHSRGGEAAPVAAAFNRLPRYPDDANLEFDFGFDIRAIVSIAPVDGQYLPAGRPMPLENVSYLVFHGSHDSDVTSFHGLRIWDRVDFTDGEDRFKTAVYMYRANHGQWNTVWNDTDVGGGRGGRILDLRPLVPGEDQRRFAELYVSAFLEATLRDDDRWLAMFRDHRVLGDWLPPTMYVTRTRHASFVPLADFEEDVDPTTGASEGVTLEGRALETWREARLDLRSRNRPTTSASQENQAVWLGWGPPSDEDATGARFVVDLPVGWASSRGIGEDHSLTLALVATDRVPGGAPPGPVDLTVEVEDADGDVARLPLSDYGPIRRPLEIRIWRRADLERERYPQDSEPILHSYHIPMTDAQESNPSFDPARVASVRLVFDRTEAGEVIVDDLGFERLPAPWWSARVR